MKFFVIFAALVAVGNAALSADVMPVLAALNPTTEGLDRGLHQGADNIKAAVQNLGATLDQAANGVADVAGNTVEGAGTTVGTAPEAVYQTLQQLSSGGPLGALFRNIL